MSADALLSRLDVVRQVGAGRWRARCPAHDGRNRDVLSIGEAGDGTVLVKCFAGCSAADVVAAVGLELHDLFPKRIHDSVHAHVARPLRKYDRDEAEHHHAYRAPTKREVRRPRVDWPAMIAACERDMLLVKIVLATIARREPINDADATACSAAATRVANVIFEARHG